MTYAAYIQGMLRAVEEQPDDAEDKQYSVYQEFENGMGEQTRRFVALSEAVRAFGHYTLNPAASIGITKRVFVTNGEDSVIMDWTYAKGLVWPRLPELTEVVPT